MLMMPFQPEFVWKKMVWWPSIIACQVSREELMLHRMRSRFSDMIAMSQERRSIRRMIAMHGRCVARQTWDPRRSSREISAWSMCNDYPDKHHKCSRPASLIANFSLTKRAQGYLFDVLKGFFFSHQFVQTCASMSVCIYVLPRGLTHGPLRGAK